MLQNNYDNGCPGLIIVQPGTTLFGTSFVDQQAQAAKAVKVLDNLLTPIRYGVNMVWDCQGQGSYNSILSAYFTKLESRTRKRGTRFGIVQPSDEIRGRLDIEQLRGRSNGNAVFKTYPILEWAITDFYGDKIPPYTVEVKPESRHMQIRVAKKVELNTIENLVSMGGIVRDYTIHVDYLADIEMDEETVAQFFDALKCWKLSTLGIVKKVGLLLARPVYKPKMLNLGDLEPRTVFPNLGGNTLILNRVENAPTIQT